MLRSWLCGSLAITVEEIDFVDPALVDQPDVRERGVRLELRYVEIGTSGSVYVSPTLTLRPAVCRIDLLESRPHAADRMHWHPAMDAGEPDDRVFDTAMREDPLQWLGARLRNVDELLSRDADEQLVPDQRDERHRGCRRRHRRGRPRRDVSDAAAVAGRAARQQGFGDGVVNLPDDLLRHTTELCRPSDDQRRRSSARRPRASAGRGAPRRRAVEVRDGQIYRWTRG